MTTDSNPSPKQFRLFTLLVAVVVCAVLLTICFVVTPRYIESAKLEHDRIWIQVTPAAQSILGGGDDADRYKIIPLRGISLAAVGL